MKLRNALSAVRVLLSILAASPEAAACGGTLVEANQIAPVSGHQMVLSMSMTQTTLWDQVAYAGDPASFAWVLPTRGLVTVGVSSDALFTELGGITAVSVSASYFCSGLPCDADATGGSEARASDSVEVLAHTVVGPYETALLSSEDPQALSDWLASRGYVIPPETLPVLDAYITEGFDFLAVKLVSGAGTDAMKPLRVTVPGASPELPLRMVATGAGASVPITLWVLSEGRYEPQNAPSRTLDASRLRWDWSTNQSNYEHTVEDQLAEMGGSGWLVQAAEPTSMPIIESDLLTLAQNDPVKSGYGDDAGAGALEACQADIDHLFAGIDPASLWVMRFRADIPPALMTQDLTLQAAAGQTKVDRDFYLDDMSKFIGIPDCPPIAPCSTSDSGGAGGASSAADSGSCAMNDSGPLSGSGLLWTLVVLGLVRAARHGRRERPRTAR